MRLTLHQHRIADMHVHFEGLGGSVTGDGGTARSVSDDREITLESTEFHSHFRLPADAATDGATVRRLFEPTFIVWCVEQASTGLFFEFEGGELVTALEGGVYDAARLDRLIVQAGEIGRRLVALEPSPEGIAVNVPAGP